MKRIMAERVNMLQSSSSELLEMERERGRGGIEIWQEEKI